MNNRKSLTDIYRTLAKTAELALEDRALIEREIMHGAVKAMAHPDCPKVLSTVATVAWHRVEINRLRRELSNRTGTHHHLPGCRRKAEQNGQGISEKKAEAEAETETEKYFIVTPFGKFSVRLDMPKHLSTPPKTSQE